MKRLSDTFSCGHAGRSGIPDSEEVEEVPDGEEIQEEETCEVCGKPGSKAKKTGKIKTGILRKLRDSF